MQNRIYDSFETELTSFLKKSSNLFTDKTVQNDIAEIEEILNDNALSLSKKCDKLIAKQNSLAGRYLLWGNKKRFFLEIKSILDSFDKDKLLENEISYFQVENLKEENNLLKYKVDDLQKDKSEGNLKLEKDYAALINKLEILNSNYKALKEKHKESISNNAFIKSDVLMLRADLSKYEEEFLKIKQQKLEQEKLYEARIKKQNEFIDQLQIESKAKFDVILKMVDQEIEDQFLTEFQKSNTLKEPSELMDTSSIEHQRKTVNQTQYSTNPQSLWTRSEYANSSTDKTVYGNEVNYDESKIFLQNVMK